LRARLGEEAVGDAGITAGDTSSRHLNNTAYWNNFLEIDPGKVAGWIFSYEEKGMRKKA